ncbi:MAG: hypothetical protein J6N78_06570 [Clostridia bacterium]|nr:hypothetical protein [Clostridia bacterium]
MKDKIIVFIIGLLVGAIITTGGFLIYEKINSDNIQIHTNEKRQMMDIPDGKTQPNQINGNQNDNAKIDRQFKNNK